MDGDVDPKRADVVILNTRLFALADNGLMAIDASAQSTAAGYGREALPRRAQLGKVISCAFRLPQLPPGHREAIWAGLVDALKELGIETDPETLQALPFEAVPLGRVLDVLPE